MSSLEIQTFEHGAAMEFAALPLKSINTLPLPDAALRYAELGIAVFPLQPRGKRPLPHSHGCKDATTDENTIRNWWKDNPNANIGIATGAPSGFFVLDVDGEEGSTSLAALEDRNSPLPITVTAKTARGVHLLFKSESGLKNTVSAIGTKLDIRTTGGYIAAPPSLHPSGHRYEWLDDGQVATAPDWMLSLMRQKEAALPTAKGTANEAVAEGRRNDALTSFAGALRNKGCGEEELLDHLMTRNSSRCVPPLPEREVRTIARSVSRYPVAQSFALTDLGNAERFQALHSDNLRYVSDAGFWLQWTGTHWREVSRDEALQMTFSIPTFIELEAQSVNDPERAKEYRKHALKSQARPRLEAALELAKSFLGIKASKLDTDPMLVAVRNGHVSLRTGELEPHNRASLITKLIDVEYDPRAPRPRWDAFIGQVSNGDVETARFLQRIAGYCLTGSCKEQCLFIFYGHGANGKSTMLETLKELFGPYAAKTPMNTFLSIKGEKPSNDLARLRGTRLVTAVEVSRSDRLNEPLLKELTGGDTLTARFLFKEFFDYRPSFKIIMSVNDLPRIEAGDAAINRRIHVVPFSATFATSDCDKDLPEKLREELPGILAWVVEGCMAWQRQGLVPPSAVRSATDNYIGTNDMLGEFIKEHCTFGEG